MSHNKQEIIAFRFLCFYTEIFMRHAKIQMSRDCFCYAFLHKYWRQNFAWKVSIWTELLQVGSKLGMWNLCGKNKTKHHNNNN